jgi:hypothetical protein
VKKCHGFLLQALLLALPAGAALAQAVPTVEIFHVQGAGMTSPYAGQTVRIENSVVTAVFNGGFFLQTPDARADSQVALTSNGIRVVTAGWPATPDGALMRADRISLDATVIEQDGETRLQPVGALSRLGSNAVLPTAVEFSLQVGRPRSHFDHLYCQGGLSNFECYEGMRVTLPDAMVVAGNLIEGGSDFGAVYVSPYGRRSLREKGVRPDDVLVPSNSLAGYWDSNAEILRMQTDTLGALPPDTPLPGGARFSATGVLSVVAGRYTFLPTDISITPQTGSLPVTAGLAETSESYRVATFDLGALCDADAGNSSVPCVTPEPGASQVATQIGRLAAYIVEVLEAPEVVAVQHVETQALLDQLAAAATAQAGAGISYAGSIGAGTNPRGLKLGFLVRTDKITIMDVSQRRADATWDGAPLHPMPPLLLEGSFSHGGETHLFRVLNMHVDDRDGVDAGNVQVRERRFQQAWSLAGLVQELQHDGSELAAPLLVLGKLNDWVYTDGYVDVHGLISGRYYDPENLRNIVVDNPVSPVLTSIVWLLPADGRITSMNYESFGAVQGESDRTIPAAGGIDHILLARDARRTAMGYGVPRANADAPQILHSMGTGAVGSSPFDAVMVRMYPGCLADPEANQDGDGWCDLFDNCPTVPNEDQADTNGNGFGDACEPEVDISVALEAAPNPVEAGGTLTVTATVTHPGGDAVEAPVLRIQMPRRFDLQSHSGGAWACNAEPGDLLGPLLDCTRATLQPGMSEVSVTGVVDPTLPAGATLWFSAEALPLDFAPDNNTVMIPVEIIPVVTDLRLVMFNPSPLVQVGDTLEFTLRTNNLGLRSAADVVVQMPRPHGTEITLVDPDAGWNCLAASPTAPVLECMRTEFAAGAQSDIRFNLLVLPSAGTSFVVNPAIASTTEDPDPDNNSVLLVFTVSDGDPEGDRIFRDGFED